MSDLKQNYKGVFDGRVGFGKRSAVLVIDFIRAYTQDGATLCAEPVVAAVRESVDLVDCAGHCARAPVYGVEFTLTVYDGERVTRQANASTGLNLWHLPLC